MSTVKVDTLVASDGTSPVTLTKQSAAKVWARYDGTTATVNNSFNVSSLSDDADGDQTLTFTNAMTDTNFAFAGDSSRFHTGNDNIASSSTVNVFTANSSHTKSDSNRVSCTIQGDLA